MIPYSMGLGGLFQVKYTGMIPQKHRFDNCFHFVSQARTRPPAKSQPPRTAVLWALSLRW
jgi:hypothetical protein